MKLYARLHNSGRKVEGLGDNDKLFIELTQKNTVVAEIHFTKDQLEIWYSKGCNRYWIGDLETGESYPDKVKATGKYGEWWKDNTSPRPPQLDDLEERE